MTTSTTPSPPRLRPTSTGSTRGSASGCAPPTTATGAPRSRPPAAAPHPSTCAAAPACSTATAPCSSNAPAPCSPPAATAAPRVCPACSDRYAADAYHLLRAGLAGDDTKHVPDTVTEHPRVFLTLTAPSFGPVHTRARHPARARHPVPLRRTPPPRRPPPRHRARPGQLRLPRARCCGRPTPGCCGPGSPSPCAAPWPPPSGSRAREFREHARLSYAKVAEYQRRGLVHFHAVIRLDGPDGPADPPPAGLDLAALRAAITAAARAATLTTHRPDGDTAGARLGHPAGPAGGHRDRAAADRGRATARSPTPPWPATSPSTPPKAPARTEGADRPIRDVAHIEHLRISDHHRRMITTAWELGGLDQYDGLNLRRWAHMLGFRGHFLTKSHALLGHLHRPPRRAADLAAARRPRPARPRHRTTATRSPPTWTPSP